MKHKRLPLPMIIIIAIVVILAIVLGLHFKAKPTQQNAQAITQGTYFAEVRKLSTGKKPTCLTHDKVLDQTVQADDKLPYEKSMSAALGTVIPDMPAGYTTTYLHTYTPTKATGYEIFSDKNQQAFVGNLKSFNFSIQRSTVNATWKLTSFTACSE